MTGDLAAAVAGFVQRFGPEALRSLAAGLDRGEPSSALAAGRPAGGYAEAVHAVLEHQGAPGLASYLRGVADGYAHRAAAERIEVVWTGPTSHCVPVRATAQVVVDVIAEATRELLLMTYSAGEHPPVRDALCAARARGVRVSVVVETLEGAGSALTGTEPAAAFLGVPGVELWHWPVVRRPAKGARMHAKVVVADRRVLFVSSANLTAAGAGANIEAGLLVHGGSAPRRAAEHVNRLIGNGDLVPLTVGSAG